MKITDTKHRLKELLNETGDTQNEMARKSGLTKSAISNYLNGTREPRQDAVYKISVAYNVSPTWLMGLDVKKEIETVSFPNKETLDKVFDFGEVEIGNEDEKKALELYEKYTKADPNIKAAIEALLKGQQ